MEYFLHILIYIGIYIILSLSLNLLVGYAGLLSIAHAAFYGIGAYIAALLALKTHSPFLLNLVLAVIGAAFTSILLGFPSLRIKEDYFAIATFAFQVIIFSVLNNWVSFTGGPMGLPGIPQPEIFGFKVSSHMEYAVMVGIICTLTIWLCRRIVLSPFGRVLTAIREDEIFTQSFGKNIPAFKIKVFMTSSALAALAGVIYATYICYIDANSFTIMESIFIISIVIIGGGGSLWGPVIGSVVLVSLPEMLRFIGLPNTAAANLRQIMYGTLLLICMLWRPQNLLGKYSFTKESKDA